MIFRIRGLVLGVAAMFLWGTINTSYRPPQSLPLWAFGYMLGVLVLAAGLQLLSTRPKGEDEDTMIGWLVVSSLLSVALGLLAAGVGLIVERVLAAAGTGWGDSATRAAWHGLAVLAFGIAVSPGVARSTSEKGDTPQ